MLCSLPSNVLSRPGSRGTHAGGTDPKQTTGSAAQFHMASSHALKPSPAGQQAEDSMVWRLFSLRRTGWPLWEARSGAELREGRRRSLEGNSKGHGAEAGPAGAMRHGDGGGRSAGRGRPAPSPQSPGGTAESEEVIPGLRRSKDRLAGQGGVGVVRGGADRETGPKNEPRGTSCWAASRTAQRGCGRDGTAGDE